VLALQLDAPLWILNQSQLPLLYSTSSASRLGRLRRRRRSNGDSNGDAEGVALGAGRRQAKAASSAASSAVGSFFRPKQGKAATESKSAKATAHGGSQVNTRVPASAAPTRAATRISMLRGRLPFGRKAKGGAEAVADAIDAGAVDVEGGGRRVHGHSARAVAGVGEGDEAGRAVLLHQHLHPLLRLAQRTLALLRQFHALLERREGCLEAEIPVLHLLDQRPDRARQVVGRDELFQVEGPEVQLLAVGAA
jgi:hypothetical protein